MGMNQMSKTANGFKVNLQRWHLAAAKSISEPGKRSIPTSRWPGRCRVGWQPTPEQKI